jgi:hypothetical protein
MMVISPTVADQSIHKSANMHAMQPVGCSIAQPTTAEHMHHHNLNLHDSHNMSAYNPLSPFITGQHSSSMCAAKTLSASKTTQLYQGARCCVEGADSKRMPAR